MKDPRDSIASTNNNKKSSDSEKSRMGVDPVTGTERPMTYSALQNKSRSEMTQTERDLVDSKADAVFGKLDKKQAERVANILKASGEGGSLEGFKLTDDESKSLNMLRNFPSYMSEYKEGDLNLPYFSGKLQGNPGRDVQAFKAGGDERFVNINPNASQGLRGLSSIYKDEGFDLSKGSDLDKAIAASMRDRSVYKK
jgi:hypothetical protein